MIFKSLFKLLGSSTIAQIILVIISPILTRIYKPEVFGLFVTLTSIVYIVNSFSQARMNVAIFSAKDKEEISIIFSLGVIFTLITMTISTLVIVFLNNIYNIERHFYLVPVMVLFLSLYQLTISLFLKEGNITFVSRDKVIQSIVLGLSQILFGLLNPTVYALALAQTFSFLFTSVFNLKYLRKLIKLINPIQYFRRYKNFILYDTGSNFFQVLSNNLAPIIITYLLGNYWGGIYYMAYRILIMPVSIFSVSISQIISSRFSMDNDPIVWNKRNNIALQVLIIFFCIPFTLLSSYIDYFVPIVFGSEWSDTSIIIRYFSAWIFLRLIYNSFSIHFSLNSKSKDKGILDVTLFIYMLLTFYLLYFFDFKGTDYLIKLAFLNTIAYIFSIYFLCFKNNFDSFKNLIYTTLSIILIYIYPSFQTIYLSLFLLGAYLVVISVIYKRISRLV